MGDVIALPIISSYDAETLVSNGLPLIEWQGIGDTTYAGSLYNNVLVAFYMIGSSEVGYIGYCKENQASFARTFTNNNSEFVTKAINNVRTGITGYFSVGETFSYISSSYPITYKYGIFASLNEALNALASYSPILSYPITYRPTNCTFPNAPTEAAVGDTVTVPVAFQEGYGIVNPSDIYVTCNGVTVPSTYNNGTLTFTMPDPSQ